MSVQPCNEFPEAASNQIKIRPCTPEMSCKVQYHSSSEVALCVVDHWTCHACNYQKSELRAICRTQGCVVAAITIGQDISVNRDNGIGLCASASASTDNGPNWIGRQNLGKKIRATRTYQSATRTEFRKDSVLQLAANDTPRRKEKKKKKLKLK